MNINIAEVEEFVGNKLGTLLVNNCTDFGICCFIMQVLSDKINEIKKTKGEKNNG